VTVRTIKVGVIGAGYWGPNLIRNFYQLPDTELVMVCDLKQERLDHIQGRYPSVKTSRDYHDLLASDAEAIVIATPVATHYKLALECLQAGKHVLIEKPAPAGRQ
jgi:predicted dehydrogenase